MYYSGTSLPAVPSSLHTVVARKTSTMTKTRTRTTTITTMTATTTTMMTMTTPTATITTTKTTKNNKENLFIINLLIIRQAIIIR